MEVHAGNRTALGRQWLWLMAVACPVMMLASYLVIVHRYRISPGPISRADGSVSCPVDHTTLYSFPFRAGQTFAFITSYANEGRLPVSIVDIQLTEWSHDKRAYYLELVDVTIATDKNLEQMVPFHRVTIAPGAVFGVTLTIRMPEEDSVGNTGRTWFGNLFLRYQVLGVNRREYVPFGHYTGLHGSAANPCDGDT